MTDERVINRIKKLMTLAGDPAASDGERDNALRMAYATLAKYNLEMSDVEGKPTGPQEARKEARTEAYGRPWAMSLAAAVGRLFFCEYYYMRSWKKDHVFHCFVGKESNADSAAEVARVLIESVFREAKRRMRAEGKNVTWRRSFCTGAMFKIQDRVRDLQARPTLENLRDEDGEEIPQLESERKSTALVLVNLSLTEKEANKAWMTKHVGELKTAASRAKPTINPDAYVKGRQFGESLNLVQCQETEMKKAAITSGPYSRSVQKTATKKTRKRRPTYKPHACETTLAAAVGDAFSAIQELRDEMTEMRDNMEEKLSHTDKYARIEECIETLESECDNEVDVPETVQELPVTYSEMVPARKGRGTSRAMRLSNAIGMLEAARDYAQAWLDEEDRGDDASDVESMIENLESAISSMEGADFPGMYG